MNNSSQTEPQRSPSGRHKFDPVLAGSVVVLLLFPLVAWLAAEGQPIAPRTPVVEALPAADGPDSYETRLRDVPVFDQEPDLDKLLNSPREMRAALAWAMTAVFDAATARDLLEVITDRDAETAIEGNRSSPVFDPTDVPYPYRYPRIERLLPERVDHPLRASDLGALLILAAAGFKGADGVSPHFPNAGYVAFAVLERARAEGACLPQLNLAFLLSADRIARDDQVAREYESAARSCRGDPTPRWLLGQFQSQRAFLDDFAERAGERVARADRLRRPFATFRYLQRSHPTLALGWSGEADAELRIAYQMNPLQPFGSRQRFRRALRLYRAARRLDSDPALVTGEARALAGLGLYGKAAMVQAQAAQRLQGNAPVQARLVEYLERARRFGAAARAAAALEASPHLPPPRSLLMGIGQDDALTGLAEQDAAGPLSIGVERMRSVRIDIGPLPGHVGGPADDLSFIPLYREVPGITCHDGWCPSWARPRDLILAHRADKALATMPTAFRTIRADRGGIASSGSTTQLAAVAALEAGHRMDAVDLFRRAREHLVPDDRPPLVALRDAQQNLWRFAGNYERASHVATAWAREAPDDADAMDRAGEIEFLRKRYPGAARWFAREVRAARSVDGGWTAREARALLKRGTALARLERWGEALSVLASAEETATRAGFYYKADNNFDLELESRFYAYHARAQAGDAALLSRRYDSASEYYAAAAELVPGLGRRTLDVEPLARTEVMFNNWSLAETRLGHGASALAAARRAVAADPANPLFRDTEGYALQRLAQPGPAARAYRAAVASDPTAFPAWNNLGIVLHDADRSGDALDALRHAVGARDDYALGWFNLAIALERRGPLHVLASQGAFGRAVQRDERFRDREHVLVPDDDVYVTRLDLSKPLPPEWEFSRTQDRAPAAAAGFALALLLALRLARTLAGQGAASGVGQRAFEATRKWTDRLPASLRFPPAVVAFSATIVVFVWPVLRQGRPIPIELALMALGCALIIAVVVRARVLAARFTGVALEQRAWSPAIAFGLAAGTLGAPWAPLPVARTSAPAPVVHWVGPVVTGLLALALLVLGVWLEVPVTRALGVAALVMAASLLTPVEPLDGGAVAREPATMAATLALLGTAVLVLIGLG